MKSYYNSPIGIIEIIYSDSGISSLIFLDEIGMESRESADKEADMFLKSGMESQCIQQLDEYFKRKRTVFDLQLDLKGTEFQKRVWNELLQIPFGRTVSYKELTLKLGDIKAIRAVGAANGSNPVSIIVPCHRVIGSDGSLTGYVGGLWRKRWLLDFESNILQLPFG